MKKILTIIGARPQFIKASVVSAAISRCISLEEVIVHTGQHYDSNMSSVFFTELGIPIPSYVLSDNGALHGAMTGNMLIKVEEILLKEKPDFVMVYGDTNSTLAGALAAAKIHIPIIHIEAGLRSFNMKMPEEVNRILTDNMSSLLFCPTDDAVTNLEKEGFSARPAVVENVGDVMLDASIFFSPHAEKPATISDHKDFILATLHRAENTDDKDKLSEIVAALNALHLKTPVILPLHPRTKKALESQGELLQVVTIPPVSYFEMVWLLNNCSLVMTDSGGVQKEAFFFGKPCVTVRDQTEWTELVELGVNTLAKATRADILEKAAQMVDHPIPVLGDLYGGGKACERIVAKILQYKLCS